VEGNTFNNCLADHLCAGSLLKQQRKKSEKSGDHAEGFFKVGGGLVGIKKSTRIGWTSWYGGFCSAISIAVIPNAHI
jgi:hypothetical protein